MLINILTLFPEFVNAGLNYGLLKTAGLNSVISCNLVDFRQYGKNKQVDDRPFGGGAGMLLKPEPIVAALEMLESPGPIYLMCPSGQQFTQRLAEQLIRQSSITLVSGRYEGFDQRIEHFVEGKISIGPFIMMGGELAALAIVETITRLLPGGIGNDDSLSEETDCDYFEYPQYTRPASFRGLTVPKELLSGHHQQIKDWRRKHRIKK